MNKFNYYTQLIKYNIYKRYYKSDIISSNIIYDWEENLRSCLKIAHPDMIVQLNKLLPLIYKEKIKPDIFLEPYFKDILIIKYNLPSLTFKIFIYPDVKLTYWIMFDDTDYYTNGEFKFFTNGDVDNIPLPLYLKNLL